MLKLIARVEIPNQCPVIWEKGTCAHVVTYGEQVARFTNSFTAAERFGHCIRHASECEGLLS